MALLMVANLAFGCTSKTMLITNPPGAKVYVNEEYYGESPAEYGDRRTVLASNEVRFELDGYQTKVAHFSKDERMNFLVAIAAYALIVPILWVMDYKSEHRYELTPLAGAIHHIVSYNQASRSVELGDSKEKVLRILEPTQIGIGAMGRREPERYIDENGNKIGIHFFRSRIRIGEPANNEDFTPYLFKDGQLVAIGWSNLGDGIRNRIRQDRH
jgi:hypothetical protein